MKLPARKTVGKAFAGVVILALLYLYYIVPAPAHLQAQASSDTTPSVEVTSTDSTTANPTPTPSVDPYAAISARAVSIVQAYYLLMPSDTARQREQRITALVPTTIMTTPDFSVGSTSCQDKARIQQKLTERATVTPGSVSVQPIGKDANSVWMLVPGKVTQYLPNGNPYAGASSCPSTRAFTATFQWQQKQGTWELVHFGNPGSSP